MVIFCLGSKILCVLRCAHFRDNAGRYYDRHSLTHGQNVPAVDAVRDRFG